MKRLIIALLVLTGITIAGCSSVSTTPTAPTPQSLTNDDQTVLQFITTNTATLDRIYDEEQATCTAGGNGDWASLQAQRAQYHAEWQAFLNDWNAQPQATTAIAPAFNAFQNAANDLVDIDDGIADILNGGNPENGKQAITQFAADRQALEDALNDTSTNDTPSL